MGYCITRAPRSLPQRRPDLFCARLPGHPINSTVPQRGQRAEGQNPCGISDSKPNERNHPGRSAEMAQRQWLPGNVGQRHGSNEGDTNSTVERIIPPWATAIYSSTMRG